MATAALRRGRCLFAPTVHLAAINHVCHSAATLCKSLINSTTQWVPLAHSPVPSITAQLPVAEVDPPPQGTHMGEFAHLSNPCVADALTASAHYHAELSANELSALSVPLGATANRCLNIDERSVQHQTLASRCMN